MFANITDRIRLFFRKEKEPYFRLYKILGFYPRNIEIYKQALLHKSLSVKTQGKLINNERLEFLGDAILDAVVADIVYKRFEGKREGFLTNTRSKIVQRETLNNIAIKIGDERQGIACGQSLEDGSRVVDRLPGIVVAPVGHPRAERGIVDLQLIHLQGDFNAQHVAKRVLGLDDRVLAEGSFAIDIGFAEGFFRDGDVGGLVAFPNDFRPMEAVAVDGSSVVEEEALDSFES